MNYNRQRLVISDISQITPDVRCFRFVSATPDKRLAGFEAGQYINLFYEINGSTASRPYSIASSPLDAEKGFYDLHIHGGGPFTAAWLFEHAVKGLPITASMPEGDFYYHPLKDSRKVIGISGGMSVTPMHSMVKAVIEETLDIHLTLFCCWDTFREVLYQKEFEEYAARSQKFHVIFALALEEREGFEKGFISRKMIERYTDISGATLFTCGPAAMYDTLREELAPLDIPSERIYQEVPGEAKWGVKGTEQFEPNIRFFLTVKGRNESFKVVSMRSDETVLIAMERAGLRPETRCRSGHCGYCESELLEGKVFTPEGWTKEEDRGCRFNPCCSFPLSDLVVHTNINL